MMLVDGDAVEAEFGGELELVEIAVVELMALHGIEIAVGQHHPDAFVPVLHAEVQVGVGHQVEEGDFHGVSPASDPVCLKYRTR